MATDQRTDPYKRASPDTWPWICRSTIGRSTEFGHEMYAPCVTCRAGRLYLERGNHRARRAAVSCANDGATRASPKTPLNRQRHTMGANCRDAPQMPDGSDPDYDTHWSGMPVFCATGKLLIRDLKTSVIQKDPRNPLSGQSKTNAFAWTRHRVRRPEDYNKRIRRSVARKSTSN